MPIQGIGSWRPTLNEFGQHWPRVNAVLAPSVLKLTAGYALADFGGDADALNAAIDGVGPLIIEAAILSAQRSNLKEALRKRATQYRLSVGGLLAGSTFAGRATDAPDTSSGFDTFFKPLNAIKQDWTLVNAVTPANAAQYGAVGFEAPLTLTGGYALADFTAQMQALTDLWPQVEAKTRDASFARDHRNALMEPMRGRLVQYRQIVPGQVADDAALIASLPRLTPPPGNTPAGANAKGEWDAALNKAHFTWPAATDAKIAHFSVRLTPGPQYHDADEITLADLPGTATSFETLEGLSVPGAVANFKIYSVAATGNENGGHAIEIVRPVV